MPEPPEQKNKKAPPPKRVSRGEEVREGGEQPEMPPIEPELRYLIDTLMEAGPVSVAGMGTAQLTWADLLAWQQGTGIELAPWEARLVRQLSAYYVQESRRAEAHDALPPWIEDDEDIARYKKARAARSLRAEMRGGGG